MKRLLPSTLITFLQENPNCLRADIFGMQLPNGQLLFTTSGQWDLNIPSGTAGWSNNIVTSQTTVSNNITSPHLSSVASANNSQYLEFAGQSSAGGGIIDIYIAGTAANTGYFFRLDTRSGYPLGQILKVSNVTAGPSGWTNIGTQLVANNASNSTAVHNVRCYLGNQGEMKIWVDGVMCCYAVDTTYTPSGVVYYGYEDVSGPTIAPMVTTVYATKYGRWSRGSITSEAGFAPKSNSMDLTCIADTSVLYPGLSIGMLPAAFNRLFDSAVINVWTAYMPLTASGAASGYGNVSNGIAPKWQGLMGKISSVTRTSIKFDCQDPTYLLNLKVPTRLFQTNCPWQFGDQNCNPSSGISAYQATFTAAGSSTNWTLVPSSAFSQAAGYFTQGVVKCLKGANAGLSQSVKLHDSSGNLEMMNQWLLAPQSGDTFIVTAGCDKTLPTCISKFNNKIHHGGFPFMMTEAAAL